MGKFVTKQLTDGATDGQHRVWEKDAFLCEMAAAVGSSLPPFTKETVDLQHLGQFQVQTAAPRHREGYTESPLTAADPVRPMRRSSSPSSAQPTKDAKAFKRTEDSDGASLHPIRQTPQTTPSSMSAGLRSENM